MLARRGSSHAPSNTIRSAIHQQRSFTSAITVTLHFINADDIVIKIDNQISRYGIPVATRKKRRRTQGTAALRSS